MLRFFLALFFSALLIPANGAQTPPFSRFFVDKILRIDYYRSGSASEERVIVERLFGYGIWPGNKEHLLEPFNYGRYRVSMLALPGEQLIFSRSYNTIFGEYQTTTPAKQGKMRVFQETVLLPYPRQRVRVVWETRDQQNRWQLIHQMELDPNDYHILQEKPLVPQARLLPLEVNGPHANHVDVVFVAEGYTLSQFDQFQKDARERAKLFFAIEPYRSLRKRFNLYALFVPSAQSGIDQPRKKVYVNSFLQASFNYFDSPRYILSDEIWRLHDAAAIVPYDALFIMVNSERYGGGGIYNQYAVFTAHSPANELVFLHEFGHSFAGLADEYYSSTVSYDSDFYPPGVEPVEPNITALLDKKHPKWQNEVEPDMVRPTPWRKNYYDSLSYARQKIRRKIQQLTFQGGAKDSIATLKRDMAQLEKALRHFIAHHPLKDKVGYFEGAGYKAHGLYRPMINCMMFSNRESRFCKVCERAIRQMIRFYSY